MTDIDQLRAALRKARDQFGFYVEQHLGKKPPNLDKAATNQEFVEMIDAALAAATPTPPGDAGWKLVPVEPTEAMLEAGKRYVRAEDDALGWAFEAMLAAVPKPAPATVEQEARELLAVQLERNRPREAAQLRAGIPLSYIRVTTIEAHRAILAALSRQPAADGDRAST